MTTLAIGALLGCALLVAAAAFLMIWRIITFDRRLKRRDLLKTQNGGTFCLTCFEWTYGGATRCTHCGGTQLKDS